MYENLYLKDSKPHLILNQDLHSNPYDNCSIVHDFNVACVPLNSFLYCNSCKSIQLLKFAFTIKDLFISHSYNYYSVFLLLLNEGMYRLFSKSNFPPHFFPHLYRWDDLIITRFCLSYLRQPQLWNPFEQVH